MQSSISVLYPEDWSDYELMDSGDGMKLERFGAYIISRPDPRILWHRSDPEAWKQAHASFVRSSSTEGHWNQIGHPPDPWHIGYKTLRFSLRPTSFKHVGIFPEQAVNWDWITARIRNRPLHILNLFAYTGGATIAAASSGARVTHVDSSKPSVDWAHDNAALSGLDGKPIRWIVDDVHKFVAREIKRGKTYDGIILDPPRFGRGPKGEVWKIEEDLPVLLGQCKKILAPRPEFVLINAYTADISSLVLLHLVRNMMQEYTGSPEAGELALTETATGRLVPHGIFARWCSL